jgi:hypothetical protein
MAGSDLPSGGIGSPPNAGVRTRRRKRGDAAAEDGAAAPRRATRSTAGLDVDGAVRWARSAAEGALWAVPGRNRGLDVDEELMGQVILEVRHARSEVEPDDPKSPYAKVSVLGHPSSRDVLRKGSLPVTRFLGAHSDGLY